ncbi:OLC1v1009745C1 [Oldenlandia corymbosa var. corymbosa]|uniref:Protein RIK n=1 Tax=Oldenlandia corymbosa var. corymbosa TaxID=529605 RepID=A0AAV1DQ68_OLDCO|nr:OLC1v1009745C1 [Oldenlandia corymbosa var. corymbosa]
MTEDNIPRVSSSESADSSTTKQRKKRKWDQPAESVVSGILPLLKMGSLPGTSLPGIATMSGVVFSNPHTGAAPTLSPAVPSLLQQPVVAISQKLNPIQDEVIAREIVINDADSNVRYKLTKRHTQEEIQKVTGAVVITRGKYKPPNTPLDGEKPLYLHISAGAHLETMAERIKAVDRAAAMVEEMLRHASLVSDVNVNRSLNACVYLGFEADPSLNIAARIRGPNDQYVNHIMNETGATVILRGHGSGSFDSAPASESQQPLHLFLSSNNLQSLERAKLLAENLLDTISAEFSVTRFSSSKVYGAVPPPPQLLAEIQSSMDQTNANVQQPSPLTASALGGNAVPLVTVPAASVIASKGQVGHLGSNSGTGLPPANLGSYSHCTLSQGTSYNGYGGIYPNATPLQQVALALRHSTSPITTSVTPIVTNASTALYASASSSVEKEKRPSQKRKFQESPVLVKGLANPNQSLLQVSEPAKPCELTSDAGGKDDKRLKTMSNGVLLNSPKVMPPPPPKFTASSSGVHSSSENGLLPNPQKAMPPPPPKFMESSTGINGGSSTNGFIPNPPKVMLPPPPKFTESSSGVRSSAKNVNNELKPESVPDTLIKLMEYGDEDEDDDEPNPPSQENLKRSSSSSTGTKPFWAV